MFYLFSLLIFAGVIAVLAFSGKKKLDDDWKRWYQKSNDSPDWINHPDGDF